MRLFELEHQNAKPSKIGNVPIDWVYGNQIFCVVDGKIRLLASYNDLEIFFFKDVPQFLIAQTTSRDSLPHYWFGGDDNGYPFMAKVSAPAFDEFKKGGEKKFFEKLKPSVVAEFERHLKVTVLRRGRLFALPLQKTWDEVVNLALFLGQIPRKKPDAVEAIQQIMNTKHTVTGLHLKMSLLGQHDVHICSGEISSPGREVLTLTEPHALLPANCIILGEKNSPNHQAA